MYSALVKLTVVQVPFGLCPFLQFDRKSLFILEPSSPAIQTSFQEEHFPFARLRHAIYRCLLTRFSKEVESIEAKVFPRASHPFIYIRTSKNTPLLTGSIIHTSSSALKCHRPIVISNGIALLCLHA